METYLINSVCGDCSISTITFPNRGLRSDLRVRNSSCFRVKIEVRVRHPSFYDRIQTTEDQSEIRPIPTVTLKYGISLRKRNENTQCNNSAHKLHGELLVHFSPDIRRTRYSVSCGPKWACRTSNCIVSCNSNYLLRPTDKPEDLLSAAPSLSRTSRLFTATRQSSDKPVTIATMRHTHTHTHTHTDD